MHILILSHLCYSPQRPHHMSTRCCTSFSICLQTSLSLSGENAVQVVSNKSAISLRSQHLELLCNGSTAVVEDRDNLPFLTTMPVVILTLVFPSIILCNARKLHNRTATVRSRWTICR